MSFDKYKSSTAEILEEAQRGRIFVLQVCLMISMTSSAVVFGSRVTDCSFGGGGALTLSHSSMIVAARAEAALIKAIDRAASGSKRRTFIIGPSQ